MIEEDTVACEHVISIAVLTHDPVAILLGHSIRRVGMEWRVLVLRNFLYFPVELRGRSLVDAAGIGQPCLTNSLKDAQYA